MQFAAALEQNSEHPIATGITAKAKELNLVLPVVKNFEAITGERNKRDYWTKENNGSKPRLFKRAIYFSHKRRCCKGEETLVFVLIDDDIAGSIALADEIRPESFDAIKTLQQNRIKTTLLTGDNATVAKGVSERLGMDDVLLLKCCHIKN